MDIRFLFVTDSVPFPPSNGKELPLSQISIGFVKKGAKVTLLTVGSDVDKALVNDVEILKLASSKKKKLKEKLNFFKGLSIYKWDREELQKIFQGHKFDVVWVSPANCYEVVDVLKTLEGFKGAKFILGLNDVKTYLYRDSLNEFIHTGGMRLKHLLNYIRSFVIKYEEKAIFKKFDLIHVQTKEESSKLKKVSKIESNKVVVAPNGRKNHLLEVKQSKKIINQSPQLLLMTQLDSGRKAEAKWFVMKVWPYILSAFPEAKLYIAGKRPTNLPDYISKTPNVHVVGFVEDYVSFLSNMDVSVVPTFHGTGLINRVLDGLTAGLPVVTTPQAAGTFDGLIHGENIMIGKKPKEFSEAILEILKDDRLHSKLSERGRMFAINHPTWEQTVTEIHDNIQKVITLKEE